MSWRAIQDTVPYSETLNALSADAERLYWRLLACSDAFGRLHGSVRKVRGRCIPLLNPKDTEIEVWLRELEAVKRIQRYAVEGTVYIQILDFDANQPREFTRKRGESKIPEPTAEDAQLMFVAQEQALAREQEEIAGTVGWTYFVQGTDGGPIKVGRTGHDPKKRLKTLQISASQPLNLLASVRGVRWEAEYHDRFASGRIIGEWFREDTPGLQEEIARLQDAPPQGRKRPEKARLEGEGELQQRKEVEVVQQLPTAQTDQELPSSEEQPSAQTVVFSTQTYVAFFVDVSRRLGSDPPVRVINQVASLLKPIVEQGKSPLIIEGGLVHMLERNLHPSTLPSCIHQAELEANGNGRKPLGRRRGVTAADLLDPLKP